MRFRRKSNKPKNLAKGEIHSRTLVGTKRCIYYPVPKVRVHGNLAPSIKSKK